MATPLLTTKLYIPPPLPNLVERPRLIERLNEGLHRKLALVSAPAGFGKTTLLNEWVEAMGRSPPPIAATGGATPPIAVAPGPLARARTGWLSLDESVNTHRVMVIAKPTG